MLFEAIESEPSDDGLHKGTALQPSRAIPSGMTL